MKHMTYKIRSYARVLLTVLIIGFGCAGATPAAQETKTPKRLVVSASIHLPKKAGVITRQVADILANRLQEYSEVKVVTSRKADLHIYLGIKPGIGLEGFRISDGPGGGISIIGNEERGLLYGAGKFLHTSTYSIYGFTPSPWRGVSVPKMPVRGMYLATHFRNYYEEAPIEEVKRYVEDLSLWGVNSYLVWFAIDAYNGIDDPKAQAMLARLRALLKTVKDLGLNASLGCVANDGYKNSPVELRADVTVGHDGYVKIPTPPVQPRTGALSQQAWRPGTGIEILRGEVRCLQEHRPGLLVHRPVR
jgi:hypothetical protein